MFNKTKFPGKPSKLVNKKRVSVLSFDNSFDKRTNDRCETDGEKNLASPKHEHGYQTETTTTAKQSSTEESEENAKPVMTTAPTTSRNIATTEMDVTEKSENDANCDSTDKGSRTTKKRVSFRQTLETSDQCKVKRVYNPNFDGPIVSIIKKESLEHPILVYKKKCYLQPSKLDEIGKNGANTIDKLNSLKFGREYANQLQHSISGDEKEKAPSNVIVASKFNLPKLSANSSRVIKPNKRFLFDTGDDSGASKKKVIKPSFWGAGGEPTSSKDKKSFGFSFVDELDLKSKKGKERKAEPPKSPDITKTSLPSSILRKPVLQLSTTFGLFGSPQDRDTSTIKSPFSLKLNSSNSSNLSSSMFTTSLVCHVCNSITTRKQPRKYGAVCCELCKKFMSKMIEKVNKNPRCRFQCDKGDGTCIIAPSTLKSHKSLKAQKLDLKTLSKGRCYACWLKKCLLNFQLPSPLKARLNDVLPKALAEATKPMAISPDNSNIFLNSMKFPSFKLSSNPLAVNNFTFGSKPDIKPNVDGVLKNAFAVDKPLLVEIPKENVIVPTIEIKKSPKSPKASPKGSPKAEKKPENPSSPTTSQTVAQAISPANVATSDALRQRVLLKGPRVKHVCRSASLVLGQPIAVFPGDGESQIIENPEDPTMDENSEKENLAFVARENVEKAKPAKENASEESSDSKLSESETLVDKPLKSSVKESENVDAANVQLQVVKKYETFDISKPITRKVTRPNLTLSQTQNTNRVSLKPVPSSKRLVFNQLPKNKNLPPMISIDFWENYDPAEVSRTGFGLILSEKTPIKSLCFLCGSCGSDPLIFCVCCCEPYHYYCVEDEFNIRFRANNFMNISKNDTADSMNISSDSGALVEHGYDMPLSKRLNWLCPRCTVCYTCNMSTGTKVKCQKCEKNYHTTCLGTSKRLLGADRPVICSSCLKCKSGTKNVCTTNVTKFIGNLPMCSNCFRLRQKGNFCPLCQKCYESNDYDVKMMECGSCRQWVHAKCEKLTDEQYNLLSALPEHIEFICKKCSPNNSAANVWRESVKSEFKTNLLSVIKLLSKSRHACVLLRLSPRKKNSRCPCIKSKLSCPTNFNSLFDALKTEDSSAPLDTQPQCNCQNAQTDLLKPSINSIKQNILDSRYQLLQEFNYDMNKILTDAQSEDLVITYNEIISEIFPWYQNETKACTDALEETMNDHSKSDLLDELMIETENGDYFMMPTFSLPENIPSNEEVTQRVFFNGKDTRTCMLCKKEGECESDEEGRLLYCGHNTWVHTNCALWSAEVYEEIDGSLQNLHSAISRGRLMKCGKCGMKGATVGCNFKNCGQQYHFQCARTICEFGVDKRVFCPEHVSRIEDTRQLETNFEVNRSVYVELDRKKKKPIEASKVQFLIGSLCVKKLGRIVPILSDAGDYLVPVDFECTRLYWSSRQPWNIVEYKIKISIQRATYHPLINDKGINLTVDHSRNNHMVQNKLKQISMFHNSISKDQEIIMQDETQDEEPQNNNDLLPPEIKAAIEDLPHDVLDGMFDGMFDNFPKDPSDSKAVFYDQVSDEDDENSKSNHVNGDGDADSDLNGFLTSIQSDFASEYNFSRKVTQEDPESKRRKLSTSPHSNDSNNNQGMKNNDKRNSNSKFISQQNELRPMITDKDTKIPQLDGLNDEIFHSDGPVACERCHCTYRNRTSFDRHLATCEIIQNTTESDSEAHDENHVYHLSNTTTTSQHQSITGMSNNNVISMINQQQNQSMASSIPIVINPFGQSTANGQNGITLSNGTMQIPNLQNLSLSIGSDGNLCQNVIVDQQGQQIYAQPLQLGQYGQTATLMPLRNFNQANVINNGNISYINASQQQPTQYIQLAPSNGGGANTQQLMTVTSQQSNEHDQHKIQKKPLLLPSPTKGKSKSSSSMQVVKSSTLMNGKKKMETMATKTQQQISIVNSKNIQIANYQTSSASPRSTQQQTTIQQPTAQNIIFQQPQQQQQLSQYPLILNQNGQLVQYIPADGQNGIQYLSQINGTSSKDVKANSQNFITNAQQASTPQIFQNSFQLPNNNTGNLVLTPNGLSVLPVQSPIVGTLIQQPQGLQCVNGVMSAEQMMLGSTPAIEMDPASGCMYLTTQPVYYGLETIVQNTVMSSQQFVSTAAMQGICQNSSFSATTTQVFQASKIEPIQMEIPTGYVFLNSSDGSIHQPQIMDSSWNVVDEKKPIEMASYGSQKAPNVIMKSSAMSQKPKVQTKVNKIQPQIVSKIIPTSSPSITKTSSHSLNTVLKTVNENPKQQQNTHVLNQNVTAKKPKAGYRTIGPKVSQEEGNKMPTSAAFIKPKVQTKPIQNNHFQSISIKPAVMSGASIQANARIEQESSPKVTLDQTYRNVQNNIIASNKAKLESSANFQTTVINLPTNVVNPIQQQNSIFNNLNNKNQSSMKSHFQNRPTNRVLPMQASATTVTVKSNKSGNIAKGCNQNGTSGNSGIHNTSLRNTSPPLANNHIPNNNSAMPPIQSEISENYCEKIKSIAMELQSSKADELFDALRRSTINNVITVTSSEFLMEKSDKKFKSSTPPRTDNFQIPSTSASNMNTHISKAPAVMKTASVCSLTKTIDSVATGANLLDDQPDSPAPIADMLPSSITITPIETPLEKNELAHVEKMNIETIFEELPDLKAAKESSVEEVSSVEEPEGLKAPEKSTFQSFDEDTTSERPSTSTGSSYAIKSSREKTPTNSSSTKVCGPKILFEIQSQDGFTYKSTSISEIWEKLFETVQLARKAHGLMPLPEGRLNEMTGDQLLGLKTNALKYLLEQLPGVEKCTRYSPKYHRRNSSTSSASSTSSFSSMNGNCSSISGLYGCSSFSSNASNLSSNSSMSTSLSSLNQYMNESDEMLYENFYGCARFEPYSARSDYDMFSWLASRHRLAPMPVHLQSNNDEVILRRGTGSNLPMAMKYRTLKESYKKSVGVYRSHIHGRGLFCTRDIEAGEMVIEYAGELIRSTLTDKRERYYDSKGIGCYMFKIDDNLVVDATMSGTAARFINHSCDPNCYSKVVDILGQKHIIIFALRRIVTGEELTYDYKFDIEDNKIPCCCGAKRCRKYMN